VGATQSTPGQNVLGSESGYLLTTPDGVAGLADFGTRLKATFSNIPSGVTIYVSTTNLNPGGNTGINLTALSNTANTYAVPALLNSGIPAGAGTSTVTSIAGSLTVNVNLLAGLVISETATAGSVVGAGSAAAFIPIQTANATNQGGVQLVPLTVDANGSATATWEVLLGDATLAETAEFAVFYQANSDPANNRPALSPTGTVNLSFAPTSSTSTASTSAPIPRFVQSTNTQTAVSVTACTTSLLFPFVSNDGGTDTGIAISNTSADPFGTRSQSGACTLNIFGKGAGTKTSFPFPSDGTSIAAGTTNAESFTALTGIASGFRGYVIAVCNFQLGHGYALFSDIGVRNWATGYLALVLPQGSSGNPRNSDKLQQGPGVAGKTEGLGN
jgi:hypothetical protein